MNKKTEVRIPWDRSNSLMLARAMSSLGIGTRFNQENGNGSLSVFLDESDDELILRLWEVLSELRVKYIAIKQVEQLTYLEDEG